MAKENDEVYRNLSIEYNNSLKNGKWEDSVSLLMKMHGILVKEGAYNDANTLCEIAKMIIENKLMTKSEEDSLPKKKNSSSGARSCKCIQERN